MVFPGMQHIFEGASTRTGLSHNFIILKKREKHNIVQEFTFFKRAFKLFLLMCYLLYEMS